MTPRAKSRNVSAARYWVWTPRSFLSASASSTASDVAPRPMAIVEPSSTRRVAIMRAMPLAASNSGASPTDISGSSCSTKTSTSFTWMKLRPSTRGMRGLTWATTRSADSAAASVMSTETPRLIQPKSSGGETWIKATWTGSSRLLKSRGTAERLIGVMKRLLRAMPWVRADPE